MSRVAITAPPIGSKLYGKGFYLTLACGHQQWVAGPTPPLNRDRECFSHPCYRFQRTWGEI